MTKDTTELKTLKDIMDHRLLEKRMIFLFEAIDASLAEQIIKQLWFLEFINNKEKITILINSPGGSVDAGLAIWDQIQMLKSPIQTVVTGISASMASILQLASPKGSRYATNNARIMIHQPSIQGVIQGQATDLNIQANEIIKTKEKLIRIYEERTKQTKEVLSKAIDRDYWMNAQEALEFGLIDKIISNQNELF